MSARPTLVPAATGTPRVRVLGPADLARVRAGTAGTAASSPALTGLGRNVETLVSDAFAHGEAVGERQGYIDGWRWGTVCGALAGGMTTALAGLALRWMLP